MAEEHTPLEEILDRGRAEPTTPAHVPVVDDPQAEHEARRARDKRGRFAPSDDDDAPPDDHKREKPEPKKEPKKPADKPADQPSAPEKPAPGQPSIIPGAQPETGNVDPADPAQAWSYAAYKDEKDKRQKAEERAARIEQSLLQTQQQMRQLMQQQQPQADPIEDPQAFVGELQQNFQAELKQIRLENSLQLAQVRHGELFDKAYEELIAAASAGDKASYLRVMNSPNIGEAVVTWWKERSTLQEIGSDPAKWREEEKARIRAEIEAEMNGGEPAAPTRPTQQQPQTAQPSNLAGVRNVGSRSGPAWSGPASLDDIFARGRRRSAIANR